MKKSKSLKYIILIVALLNATLISNFNIQPTFAQEASRTGASTGLCKSSRRINGIVTSEKVISFTFDDGPWPTNTNAVMNSFEKYGWKATFFMVGRNIKANPAIAKSVASRGHEVGNHSMTHPTTQSAIAKKLLQRITSSNLIPAWRQLISGRREATSVAATAPLVRLRLEMVFVTSGQTPIWGLA